MDEAYQTFFTEHRVEQDKRQPTAINVHAVEDQQNSEATAVDPNVAAFRPQRPPQQQFRHQQGGNRGNRARGQGNFRGNSNNNRSSQNQGNNASRNGKFQWQRLENMITMARSESNFDLLPTAQLGITFLLSEEGRYLRRQLLLALTEDDRLHTAEVQRLWGLIQGELQPRRLLDVAMSAFRELSSQGVAAVLPRETSSR